MERDIDEERKTNGERKDESEVKTLRGKVRRREKT